MIQDLENIIVSYLDPDSYKTLQQYNPKKYNKLHQIKTEYEKIIPDVTKLNVFNTGVILKTSMVILFSEIIETKSDNVKDQIYGLIFDWFNSSVRDLIKEYKSVDLEPISYYEAFVDNNDLQIKYMTENSSEFYNLSFGDNVIRNHQTFKSINSVHSIINHVKEIDAIILSDDPTMLLSWFQVIGKLTDVSLNNDMKLLSKCKSISEVPKKTIVKILEFRDHFTIGPHAQRLLSPVFKEIYERSNKLIGEQIFQFHDFNDEYAKYKNSRRQICPANLPKDFAQCLYYILETANKLWWIYQEYKDMTIVDLGVFEFMWIYIKKKMQ